MKRLLNIDFALVQAIYWMLYTVAGSFVSVLLLEKDYTNASIGTIIAVDVSPPAGPRASSDYGLSVSGWRALAATVRKGRSEFPGLTTILMRSVIVGSISQRAQSLEEARVDLLLELHVRGLGLLDFDVKVEPVIKQGAELARPELEAWIASRAAAD